MYRVAQYFYLETVATKGQRTRNHVQKIYEKHREHYGNELKRLPEKSAQSSLYIVENLYA